MLLAGAGAHGAQGRPATPAAIPPTAAAPFLGKPAASAAGASIQFDSTVFNFGRLKSGESAKHEFVFTNTGTATLEITAVTVGCGCTTAGEWDKKVEPGKTGKIPLQFNSGGFGGPVTKSATVACNDPARSSIMLQITGTVWKPIDLTPATAMFNLSAEALTNETRVLRIVSNLEEPVTLSDLQCNNAAFKTELKEVKPGKEFELMVTAVPPFATPMVFATITIKTSSKEVPVLRASAYVVVQQPVVVSPQNPASRSPSIRPGWSAATTTKPRLAQWVISVSDWWRSVDELSAANSFANSNCFVCGPRTGNGSDSVSKMRRLRTGRKPSSPSLVRAEAPTAL